MTQPTHTHSQHGGKFAYIGELNGGKVYDSETLVIYHDLDKNITSHVVEKEWQARWRAIEPDDCTVCLGTGHDHFKGNKDKPCGGCYGLGKVREDGETPAEPWELAAVATGIIQRQQAELIKQRQQLAMPDVKEALQAAEMQRITDSVARQEQEWRDGRGHGPHGRRHTGD